MTFRPDSSLVDAVVPSPTGEWYDRKGMPVSGAAVHMAEGGGTDTHLRRLDGNSSHYVVKYTGALVQMVPERYAAGSMNPRLTRTTDDAGRVDQSGVPYRLGISALKAVMGSVSPTYVNRVFIAIEVEGFAASGPNELQYRTLVPLVRELASRYPSWRGLIGHRDQQSYKPCPGNNIHWSRLGGHGLWLPDTSTEGDLIRAYGFPLQRVAGTDVTLYLPDGRSQFVASLNVLADQALYAIDQDHAPKGSGWIRLAARPYAGWYVSAASVQVVPPEAPVDETPYDSADIQAAVEADRARAYVAYR